MTLPSQILDAAADLIEPEGRWTQGRFGIDRQGRDTWIPSPGDQCFCAAGAIKAVVGPSVAGYSIWKPWLEPIVGEPVSRWNDHPDRTQSEVVQALRKAADLARGEGR